MDKIIKIFKAEIKSIDVEKKRAVVVVSTDKKDGDGDIVTPESFNKRLRRYKDHPVLLSSHNYYELTKQIGMSHGLKMNEKDVEAEFEWFAGQGNPEADWGWFLAQKGIAAFSIGFQGLSFDWIEEKDESGNKRITGRKFLEIELLEISQVLVPSNAGALQNSINDARTPVEAKEMCELVLKGMKDGKIIYEEKSLQSKKDANLNLSDHESRIIMLEKQYESMKQQHDALCVRMEEIENAQDVGSGIDESGQEINGGKKKKPHYSKTLLGADALEHKQTPNNETSLKSELKAIEEAFKV